jgi:hypothetical protein
MQNQLAARIFEGQEEAKKHFIIIISAKTFMLSSGFRVALLPFTIGTYIQEWIFENPFALRAE